MPDVTHRLLEKTRSRGITARTATPLRIVVTALGTLTCLFLVILWVRSYTFRDSVGISVSKAKMLRVDSEHGVLEFETYGRNMGEWGAFARSLSHRVIAEVWRRDAPFLSEPPPPEMWRWEATPAGRFYIHVPHWFPFLLAAFIAAAPWIKRQYSLRTLLVIVSLVSLALGLLVMWV